MSLTKEYERKINVLLENLPKREYKKVAETEFEGFSTRERLSLDEAKSHERTPLEVGFECGKKWEYIWLFATVDIPAECEGSKIEFKADYKEGLVFVNGKVVGAIDRAHRSITLTKCAKAKETFEIAMEVYAGHDGPVRMADQRLQMAILLPDEQNDEFGDDINQVVIKNGEIGKFDDEIFFLQTDIEILYDLYKVVEKSSLRAARISKALKEVCNTINIEAEPENFAQMVKQAREILKPVLECKNGSTSPVFYAVSHSHLDLEWLWTREETRRKVARTMGNQLAIAEEYPEHKYLQSQAWIFNTIKNEYPDLYEDVKKAVAKGMVVPEGGMWVESDVNITSGESIIRQFLFGKQFFADEFGINSEIFWLPDSFGLSGSLPQILKKCGIKYLINCKLKWIFNDDEVFPHNSFMWKGIDGSEILTHISCGKRSGYQSEMMPSDVVHIWERNNVKEDVPYQIINYGFGDGGGGSVRKHHEMLKREGDLEGMPKVIAASPNEFFEKLESDCDIKTTYVGELYFSAHRGTYTSQAKTKDLMRRNEFALREAEMWSALLGADTKAQTDELWKTVLFDQFHDILPGTSIKRVYEVVESELNDTLKKAADVTETVLNGAVAAGERSLTIANSLSWDRQAIIALPEGYTSLTDENGNAAETQIVDGAVYAMVSAPSCGYKSYTLGNNECKCGSIDKKEVVLENDLIRAEFNEKGELISVIDKESHVEFLSNASNKFRMYQDMPTAYDAWDIDSFYEDVECNIDAEVTVNAVKHGTIVSYLDVTKQFNKSCIKQRISLEKGSKSINFETEVDWQESHKLLKVDFNTNIQTENLISETQFGYISRPNHKSRQYDADRFEVCQHKWSALAEQKRGVAILNNNKYGISSNGGKMSLTLLKSSEHPARNADKGLQKFTYSFMLFTESLFDSNVVTSAYELNCPIVITEGAAEEKSYINVDKRNVIISSVKHSEDNTDDIIIRMYESKNSYTNCRVEFDFEIEKAYITNMLEENEKEIDIYGNSIELSLKAFEVITLRLVKKKFL